MGFRWCPRIAEAECTADDALATHFMDIRRKTYSLAAMAAQSARKSSMVCVPTTSGTGSEMSPFAVITDEGQRKLPLAG